MANYSVEIFACVLLNILVDFLATSSVPLTALLRAEEPPLQPPTPLPLPITTPQTCLGRIGKESVQNHKEIPKVFIGRCERKGKGLPPLEMQFENPFTLEYSTSTTQEKKIRCANSRRNPWFSSRANEHVGLCGCPLETGKIGS